ncbi:hypothetical protein ACFY7C_19675 [Streptomyces sp. NPDC012769]|uniref:hypothetical protein n=1 Tax=Streptomyces sp. NPDC012769 TaxID=3364848 RepID=UPI0036854BD0
MSAREYKEWEAYERAVGPLDSSYDREILCEIHELLQLNNQLTGAAITKKGKKNPAGKFRQAIRPEALYLPPEDEEEDDDEDEYADYYDEVDDDEEEEDFHEKSDPNAYDPAKDPFIYM